MLIHANVDVRTSPTNARWKKRQSRWNSGSCLLSFLLVCQHCGLCPARVLFMAFAGELLEWLSVGHAFGSLHTCKRLSWKKRRIYHILVARTVPRLDGYFFFGKFYISNKYLLYLNNMNCSGERIPLYNKCRKGRNNLWWMLSTNLLVLFTQTFINDQGGRMNAKFSA